jgi:glucose-6-phosphate isomerase
MGEAHWVKSQAISLDYNYAMADFIGAPGLTDADLKGLIPRLVAVQQQITADHQAGRLGFMDLPYNKDMVQEIKRVAKPYLEYVWHLVVLGIGGSALGARALHQALCHPQHNLLPMARKHYKPALWVLDNIDPDTIYNTLDALDLRRTIFNVISKSGSTAETLAQFLWIYQVFKGRFADKARDRVIITTDPEKGPLRHLASQQRFPSLNVPYNVGGRFSVLSHVGLFPAHMAGIDLEELLAGARYMDQRLKQAPVEQNLALNLAALCYLFATAKARPILVIMPYASALGGLAEWFCQLWAESIGKKFSLDGSVVHTGSTPVKAVGATDQHSQLQLYMEGPPDKLIIFLEVEKFQHTLAIPDLYPDRESLHYLGGHSINDLLKWECQATAFNLRQAGRPSLTLRLPEINAFTIGQLIYLLEVATVAAGGLFGVNPLDQPGVEGGKKTTYGLMGRPGFEQFRQEFQEATPSREDYVLKWTP